MAIYRTNKGRPIDMDAIRAQNEKTIAVGNMGVNAKGEKIKNGKVVETSNKRVRQHVNISPSQKASLKPQENVKDLKDMAENVEPTKKTAKSQKASKPTSSKKVEKELDNGDIVIDDEE